MPKQTGAIWAMVVATTLFWGSNFNAVHAIATTIPTLTAAAERFDIAVIVLLAVRLLRPGAESALSAKDMGVLVALGLLGVFGYNYAFFAALHTTTPLNGALIMGLSPLVTSLFSARLLGSRITPMQLLGLGVAFGGVALVITGGHIADIHIASGDALMSLGCVIWSLYNVLVRKYAGHIPSPQQTRWTLTAGAVAFTTAALLHEHPLATLQRQSHTDTAILLYIALCGTVLAYLFWLRGIETLGPHRAAIAFNLVPVFTLLVNLTCGHLPAPEQLLGMVLVVCGVLISIDWRPARPTHASKSGQHAPVMLE